MSQVWETLILAGVKILKSFLNGNIFDFFGFQRNINTLYIAKEICLKIKIIILIFFAKKTEKIDLFAKFNFEG